MLSLREYRNRTDRLADHLPWAALIAPGVVLNKDGSFQRTARFRGPDLESATEAELVSACARANNCSSASGRAGPCISKLSGAKRSAIRRATFPMPRHGSSTRNAAPGSRMRASISRAATI